MRQRWLTIFGPLPLVLAVLVLAGHSQFASAQQAGVSFGGAGGQNALTQPSFDPNGLWARVISVSPKWLVLENAQGQQLPVSATAVDVFVMRWPIDPRLAEPGAWAEVTGIDLNSGGVLTDHVDIYQGPDRALVTPTSRYLFGYNRELLQVSPYLFNTFATPSPLLPGEELIPRRRHVVGPLLSGVPMIIAVPGNDAVSVITDPGSGFNVTQVTPGSPGFVKPGDIVWYVAVGADARTMAVARLVVYKDVPLNQFVP